jgi:hypothetical protein
MFVIYSIAVDEDCVEFDFPSPDPDFQKEQRVP